QKVGILLNSSYDYLKKYKESLIKERTKILKDIINLNLEINKGNNINYNKQIISFLEKKLSLLFYEINFVDEIQKDKRTLLSV
ncbi:MAG: hypothetical protein QXU98_12705, partial [Candidatus Parvarchaeota archaeon]